MNKIIERKHLIDRKKHKTMIKKIDGTENKFIVDTGSLVTKLPPNKEVIKDKKIIGYKEISGRY